MLMYKTWKKVNCKGNPFVKAFYTEYEYKGWFLFGLIPLMIKRRTVRTY